MARKSAKSEPNKVDAAATQDQEMKGDQPSITEQKAKRAEKKANAKTSNGYVEARLKARRCSGGICKQAGETMRMTRGEYERLKKHDRVE